MTAPEPDREPDRLTWLQRRRDKVVEEIERNRRGGHTVPTWVLTVILLAIVGAWAAVIVLAGPPR
jgi:hypothetical protein